MKYSTQDKTPIVVYTITGFFYSMHGFYSGHRLTSSLTQNNSEVIVNFQFWYSLLLGTPSQTSSPSEPFWSTFLTFMIDVASWEKFGLHSHTGFGTVDYKRLMPNRPPGDGFYNALTSGPFFPPAGQPARIKMLIRYRQIRTYRKNKPSEIIS